MFFIGTLYNKYDLICSLCSTTLSPCLVYSFLNMLILQFICSLQQYQDRVFVMEGSKCKNIEIYYWIMSKYRKKYQDVQLSSIWPSPHMLPSHRIEWSRPLLQSSTNTAVTINHCTVHTHHKSLIYTLSVSRVCTIYYSSSSFVNLQYIMTAIYTSGHRTTIIQTIPKHLSLSKNQLAFHFTYIHTISFN